MIVFLHANPISAGNPIFNAETLQPLQEETKEGSLEEGATQNNEEPKYSDDRMVIPAYFKSDLLDVLSKKNKILNLKIDVLTRESLQEAVNLGCRILCLSSEVVSEEGLIVEDAEFRPTLITFQELEEIFYKTKTRQRSATIDSSSPLTKCKLQMVIIASRSGSNLASWFAESMLIPHVIYFDFNQNPEERYKYKLYQQEYIMKFVQFFLNELIDDKTLQDSFDTAIRDTLDCLSYSFFNLADDQRIISTIGTGAILLPLSQKDQINPHAQSFYGYGQFVLQNGKFEDLSMQKYFTTVIKTIVPFFGRSKETREIIDYALTDPAMQDGFLKILGEPGVGKTRLVLEAAWYLVGRSVFPDGVFYFPLGKVNQMNVYNLLETAALKLGITMDKNYANFFRKKKMLVIFDDFDAFYSGDIEPPLLLLSIIKKYKIPVIFTCTKIASREDLDEVSSENLKLFKEMEAKVESKYVSKTLTLSRLSDENIANMVVSLTSNGYEGAMSFKEARENPIIKEINGLPCGVIERIHGKKISYKDTPLQILPYYKPFLMLNKIYRYYFKTGQVFPELEDKMHALMVSRHAVMFKTEVRNMNATKESMEIDFVTKKVVRIEEPTEFQLVKNRSSRARKTAGNEISKLAIPESLLKSAFETRIKSKDYL